MSLYKAELEIAGDFAMFTRPDTGDAPVSYPGPTFSACKGIIESVCFLESARVIPLKVEICRPVRFQTISFNYKGPGRETKAITGDETYQRRATVLVDVCYRIYADIVRRQGHGKPGNGAHAFMDIFNRRLARQQFFTIPFLGWRAFSASYCGPFRPETTVCQSINLTIPSMLREVFPGGHGAPEAPYADSNVKIENGVLTYA
jgi:CRISPR-associated protein Cas5d